MKKLIEYKYIILVVVVILGFAFYWYSYRPEKIKKHCYYISAELKENLLPDADLTSSDSYSLASETAKTNYYSCLSASGL